MYGFQLEFGFGLLLVDLEDKKTPLPGLEPGIFSLGGKHLIHWATGAIYFFKIFIYKESFSLLFINFYFL